MQLGRCLVLAAAPLALAASALASAQPPRAELIGIWHACPTCAPRWLIASDPDEPL